MDGVPPLPHPRVGRAGRLGPGSAAAAPYRLHDRVVLTSVFLTLQITSKKTEFSLLNISRLNFLCLCGKLEEREKE